MPKPPQLRVSDEDRERMVAMLREHAALGRLTIEEFSERTKRALAARTLGDLAALAVDLPSQRRRAGGLGPLRMRSPLGIYAVTNAVLVGAWVVTNKPGGLGAGPEPFWPAWPMLGSGLGWGLLLVGRALRGRQVRARAREARSG